jgi:hypothetical protein
MPEAQRQKNYFQLNRGINSEASELTLQDGFTRDEVNFELLVDGSRARRQPLREEDSGATMTITTVAAATAHSQVFVWRGAGGDPDSNFIVHKIGRYIYFTTDEDGGSANFHSESLDTQDFSIPNQGLTMATLPIDFTVGRGILFMTGENMLPTAVEYDATGDSFSTSSFEPQIRDYEGIRDGTALDYEPPSGKAGAAVIADVQADFPDHYYNLLCRGWNATDIIDYENNVTGTARYPSKQQYWVRGYKRSYGANVAEQDGTYSFDAAKMDAEIFGGSDAPRGSMIINVFDDTTGFKEVSLDATGTFTEITGGNFAATDGASVWTVRVTDASHTFSVNDEVFWKDKPVMFYPGVPASIPVIFGDTSTITAISAGAWWEFEINDFNEDFGWTDSLASFSNGSYWGTDPVARSSGTGPLTTAPTAIEFHGGRLFFAGIQDATWDGYIFFSQVVQDSDNWYRCHTDADPTAKDFNAPVITDGGFFVVENMGKVLKLLSLQDSLLVFTDQGVWEITGRGTFFDPSNYNVRKVTNAPCGSPYSPIEVEGNAVYTGPTGVYLIAPNQFTRQLEATNISDERIRTFWNDIGPTYEPLVSTVYDDSTKRLYFLQGGTNNHTLEAPVQNTAGKLVVGLIWVYDILQDAWYKWNFDQNATGSSGIMHGFVLTGQDADSGAKKLKFAVLRSATTFEIMDFTGAGTGFQDWTGNTNEASMLTAHDGAGDFSRRKQAPIITMYMKDKNTGYTATGNGFSENNPSWVGMTAYWDWTDDTVSGKITDEINVYRKVRGFAPSGTGDVDGYPVVVTRNKLRGRGRALQLRFRASSSASGEDCHILGYTVVYKVSRRK